MISGKDMTEPSPQVGGDTTSPAPRPHKYWRLLVQKQRWGLSRRGWLALAATGSLACYLLLLNIHPFLAVTKRVDAEVLVVEGWIHEYSIRFGAKEFERGGYQRVFTTGGPVNGTGGYSNDYNTSASVGADLLSKAGVARERVQMVPARVMGRDRTYSSAIALRDWFRAQKTPIRSLNIVTEDAHARRTRLLFQKALGKGVTVGIISVPNPDYDPKHWWRYSEGVREMLGEGIAYLYARFLFHPADPDPKDQSAD